MGGRTHAVVNDPDSVRIDYSQYAWNLSRYTSQILGDQNDALRAMAGIIRRDSEKIASSMLESLPIRAMESFMSFVGRNLRRRRGFPSYSWTGWIGGVEVSIGTGYTMLNTNKWISWYKVIPGMFPVAEAVGAYHRHSNSGILEDGFRHRRLKVANPFPRN